MCRIVLLLLQHLLLLLLTRLPLLLHPRVHFGSGLSRPTATANPFCFLHRETSPSHSNSHINMFFPVVCPIGCRQNLTKKYKQTHGWPCRLVLYMCLYAVTDFHNGFQVHICP